MIFGKKGRQERRKERGEGEGRKEREEMEGRKEGREEREQGRNGMKEILKEKLFRNPKENLKDT